MSRNSICSLCLCLVILSTGAVFGQVSSAERTSASAAAPLTATAGKGRVRFASLGLVQKMRLEVVDQGGNLIYDSEACPGSILDWKIEDRAGRLLPDGLYGATVTMEDVAGFRTSRRAVFRVKGGGVLFAERRNRNAEAGVGEDEEAVTILAADEGLPLAHLAHDGTAGVVASGKGALSFRTGDLLAATEVEQMRLTTEGDLGLGIGEPAAKLDVAGLIRTSEGIQFPDGTIQRTAARSGGFGTLAGAQWLVGRPAISSGRFAGSRVAGSGGRVPSSRVAASEGATNTFYGLSAGAGNTSGYNNSFFGKDAGLANTLGHSNAFFGFGAGSSNIQGEFNSFFGSGAGAGNTSGGDNAFFGRDAGSSNTSAGSNSFFGASSGSSTTTGQLNSFFGATSGYFNTTGYYNSFFGTGAGYNNTTGYQNAFFGTNAGLKNTTGLYNAFSGFGAGSFNTTGGYNTSVGFNAGLSNTIESNNTFLGSYSNGAIGISGATAVGFRAQVGRSNSLVLGSIDGVNGASADTFVGIGTTTPDRLLVLEGAQALARFTRYNDSGSSFAPAYLCERGRGSRSSPLDILAGDHLGKVQFRGRVGGSMLEYGVFSFVATDTAQNGRFAFLDRDLATERVSILNTGNVGIGTIAPNERLHVVGNIRVTGSILSGAPEVEVPDYVFEPDYERMTIEELGRFIAREKHLPNVPRESEIREHGLDIGKFQMKLLEKIEELTLYAVEAARTIREKEAEAARLKLANADLDARLAAVEDKVRELARRQR